MKRRNTIWKKIMDPALWPVMVQAIGFILVLWLGTKFVSQTTFEKHEAVNHENVERNDAAHEKIAVALTDISKAIALLESNAKAIAQIDERQREVMRDLATHDVRLRHIETQLAIKMGITTTP